MKKQWLRKIGLILLSVFVLSLLVFVMSRLAPGDPLVSYYGERAERMSVEESDASICSTDLPIGQDHMPHFPEGALDSH